MDIRAIVAANLRALMTYATEQKRTDAGPGSQKALALFTKLGRGTIQRALGLSDTNTAIAIDTLEAIARAYDLQAWQMLLPDLDPTNPPIVAVTATEKLLTERLKAVSGEFVRRLEQEQARARGGAGSHRPRSASRKGKRKRTPTA